MILFIFRIGVILKISDSDSITTTDILNSIFLICYTFNLLIVANAIKQYEIVRIALTFLHFVCLLLFLLINIDILSTVKYR